MSSMADQGRVADYRRRIYENYGRDFQDASPVFDSVAAKRWGRSKKWHLRRWLPPRTEAAVLDVACGGGKLLHFFSSLGYENVFGVDISPDQVALAKQVNSNVSHGDVIDLLESSPLRFDLITGFDIIEHFHKPEVLRFLDAAYLALRPGGRLILQTPNAECPWGAQHRYNDFTHEVGFNPNSIRRLFALTGYTQVDARECDPPPIGYSMASSIRAVLWQGIRLCLMGYNFVETGSSGDGVFTRVFLASGVKPN